MLEASCVFRRWAAPSAMGLALAACSLACGGGVGSDGEDLSTSSTAPPPSPGDGRPLQGTESEGTGVGDAPGTTPLGSPDAVGCSAGNDINRNLDVETQSDLERLAGCTTFDGSLSIVFERDLDLTPLAGLEVIKGTLSVRPSLAPEGRPQARLSSLHGLEGLTRVEGLALANVDGGLEPLAGLTGEVDSLMLSDVSGVPDLQPLRGIVVTRQLALELMLDLEALNGIRVGADLAELSVWESPQVQDLRGMEGLVNLGSLTLYHAASIRSPFLPDTLLSLDYASFDGLPELTTLTELSRFTTLSTLRVSDSPLLADLGGGGEDGSLTFLTVVGCPALTELSPVGGLSSLEHVSIVDCAGLVEVDELGATGALRELSVVNNPNLERLPSFDRVTNEMVNITLRNNAALVTGPSFPSLRVLYDLEARFYEAAELEVIDNPVLTSIGSYPLLESMTMLTLINNPALSAVSLPSLRSLSWLRLRGNTNLAQLELGVPQGLRVVEVTDNVRLDTLTLGAPTGPLLRLELHGNPALGAEAQQLLLDLVGEETTLTLE